MRIAINDTAIDQLFETLLWQAAGDYETGEHLDTLGFERSDIDRDSQNALIGQFQSFIMNNEQDLHSYMEHTGRAMDDVAHDYILTANGHGAGFWDRCYCGDDDAADRLSDNARADGDIDVYIGDDGNLYITL